MLIITGSKHPFKKLHGIIPPPPPPDDGGGIITGPDIIAQDDFAHNSFNNWFNNFPGPGSGPGDVVDIVPDPTGQLGGLVGRARYKGTNEDKNRYYSAGGGTAPIIGLGQSVFCQSRIVPNGAPDSVSPFYQRKLFYYQKNAYFNNLLTGNPQQYWHILLLFGTELHVYNGITRQTGPFERMSPTLANIDLGVAHKFETEMRFNTSFTAEDGISRVWLDDVLVDEATNLSWSDPAWVGHYNPADQGFNLFLLGQQVNAQINFSVPTPYPFVFDEYRHFKRSILSRTRQP